MLVFGCFGCFCCFVFFFQAEDGIRDLVRSRGSEMCIRDRVKAMCGEFGEVTVIIGLIINFLAFVPPFVSFRDTLSNANV